MATTERNTITCDSCGCEGERGEHPGEGAIVPAGGETFGGRLESSGSYCDDCADAAQDAQQNAERLDLILADLCADAREVAPGITHVSDEAGCDWICRTADWRAALEEAGRRFEGRQVRRQNAEDVIGPAQVYELLCDETQPSVCPGARGARDAETLASMARGNRDVITWALESEREAWVEIAERAIVVLVGGDRAKAVEQWRAGASS